MKIKYCAIAALVMAQLSISVSASDADGIITVTGTVTPTSCTINAPSFDFGSVAINDIVESVVAFQRQESNAVTVQCTDNVVASSLVFTGVGHDFNINDLALSGSDGTVYRNGVIAYQPRILTDNSPTTTQLAEVLGITLPGSLCSTCSVVIRNGVNMISPTGTGAFSSTPFIIPFDHRLQSRGRANADIHVMPEDSYSTTMSIALTY